MRSPFPRLGAVSAISVFMATLVGCGLVGEDQGDERAADAVTVDSCGRKVSFDSTPERILAIGSEAPSLLVAAGAGDKLTHYAGSLEVPFESETKAVLKDVERLTEDSHDVSYEMIVNSGVDVVIGTDITSGVDIDALAIRLDKAGVQLLTVSGYCAGIEGRSTEGVSGFDLIYRDIEAYGRVFDTQKQATGAVDDLRDRVKLATERVNKAETRTAVPLYVPAEGTLGSYGGESLVSEQMDLIGIDNVFKDVSKRYFEPSTEELVDRAPDLVFAMYLPTGSSGLETDADVVGELRGRQEIDGIAAVDGDQAVLPLNYYYASPGPLAVTGLEILSEQLTGS